MFQPTLIQPTTHSIGIMYIVNDNLGDKSRMEDWRSM